jgi:putative ABC transport system permease protein
MTTQRASTPPALALSLLEHFLPFSEREAIVGDLIEEFGDDRLPQSGAFRARVWFWRETLSAIVAVRRRSSRMARPPITGDSLMRLFLGDLRYASRLLRRAPMFTALCVLTLGLTIGATTAIFSIVNPILIRPLPYPRPGQLALVWERERDGSPDNVGFATVADLRRDAKTLQSVAAVGDWTPTITAEGEPERLQGERVSSTYFAMLGVAPAIGRDFRPEEDAPGKNRVVMLSDRLWRRRFGADPSIVGRTILLDGNAHVVAGVMPSSFDNVTGPTSQIWRVLGYDTSLPYACRTCHHLRMIARIRDGVSPAAAASELDQLFGGLRAAYPDQYASVGMLVTPMQDQVTQPFRPALLAVLGAAVLVLLIAVANVTNLQLARATRREEEFAIRAALGAGRARLAYQLLAEGVVLAVLSACAGVLVAWLVLPSMIAQLPMNLPRRDAIHLDGFALAVAAAMSLALAILIGLTPAWQAGRLALFASIRAGARLTGGVRQWVRAGLVVTEVALALMLLSGAGLVSRSLLRLLSVDPGFDASHLLTMEVDAVGPRYADGSSVYAFHDRIRAVVRALPGVTGAEFANQIPMAGNVDRNGVRAFDKPTANPELVPSADRYAVSSGYMRMMRIPLIAGRTFTDADTRDSAPPSVIVSAALAKRIWPGEDALGKRVQFGEPTRPWYTVVGVAGDVRHTGLDATVTQQVYIPERGWFYTDNQGLLVVRTAGDPAALAATVRRVVSAVDPTQPIYQVATMDELIAQGTAQRRLAMVLFVAFGIAAGLLAAAGIFGVLAGNVAARTREIGLRSALGAAPRDILGLVVRHGMTLAAGGAAIGLAGALGLTRYLRTLLYEIGPNDPVTLGGVVVLIGVVAVVACLVPARRALRVDPIASLRAD